MNKQAIVVFGEMGAGKNYHGERIAKSLGIPFLDGDTVLPPELAERVRQFKPLSRDMIRSYVTGPLFDTILSKSAKDGIVVAQALYCDEDRLSLKRRLEIWGYEVQFVWIRAPFFRNLRQILARKNGRKWAMYWMLSKPWFQKPSHSYKDPPVQ